MCRVRSALMRHQANAASGAAATRLKCPVVRATTAGAQAKARPPLKASSLVVAKARRASAYPQSAVSTVTRSRTMLNAAMTPMTGISGSAAFNLVLLITTVITALCVYGWLASRSRRPGWRPSSAAWRSPGRRCWWRERPGTSAWWRRGRSPRSPVRHPGRAHPQDPLRRARRTLHGVGGLLRSVFCRLLPDGHRPLRELAPRAHHPSPRTTPCPGCGC